MSFPLHPQFLNVGICACGDRPPELNIELEVKGFAVQSELRHFFPTGWFRFLALLGNLHMEIQDQAKSCSCGNPFGSEERPWLPIFRQLAVFNTAASTRPCEAWGSGRDSGSKHRELAGARAGVQTVETVETKVWKLHKNKRKPWKPYNFQKRTKSFLFLQSLRFPWFPFVFVRFPYFAFHGFHGFHPQGDLGSCARPGSAQ